MTDVQKIIEKLTIDFLIKNNCDISKIENGYNVNPGNSNLDFLKIPLQIHFDETQKIEKYELIAPGSQFLHKILSSSLNYGPVLFGKWKNFQNPHIRFNFYILFESVYSENFLDSVDIDLKTLEVSQIDESQVDYIENLNLSENLKNVDDAYVEAIDFIEKKIRHKVADFKDKIQKLEQSEINDVEFDFVKKIKDTEDQASFLRSTGEFGGKFDKLIEKNEFLKNEKNLLIKRINEKYSILVDVALTSSLVVF